MKIILLTGFLGAGKTTLLSRLLNSDMTGKVGVLVNEFGEVGVDGRVVHHADAQMIELNKGSIFCACLKSKFYEALALMEERKVDWLFVEASGLADPSTMETAIRFLKERGRGADYYGAVCLVDAVYFPAQVEALPVLERQVWYSDLILLNKTDLQTEEGLVKVEEKLLEIQPTNQIIRTQYCNVEVGSLLGSLAHQRKMVKPSLNTRDSRMVTFTIRDQKIYSLNHWKQLIERTAQNSYRLKGFIRAVEGGYYVSGVGGHLRWEVADDCKETELVVFSAVGVGLINTVIGQAKGLDLDCIVIQ